MPWFSRETQEAADGLVQREVRPSLGEIRKASCRRWSGTERGSERSRSTTSAGKGRHMRATPGRPQKSGLSQTEARKPMKMQQAWDWERGHWAQRMQVKWQGLRETAFQREDLTSVFPAQSQVLIAGCAAATCSSASGSRGILHSCVSCGNLFSFCLSPRHIL